MQRRDEVFLSVLVLTIIGLAAFVSLTPVPARQPGLSGNLRNFGSYSQLRDYISQGGVRYRSGIMTYLPAFDVAANAVNAPSASTSYTTTNIQVQGVDEADMLKNDGSYLYVAGGENVSIIRAAPANATSVVSVLKYGGSVDGLFISQGRLVVIETGQAVVNRTYYWYSPVTSFLIYDVSNVSSPALIKTISLNGSYVDSRLSGGYVYAVVQQPTHFYTPNGNSTLVVPTVTDENGTAAISPSDVYYSPNSTTSFGQYTIILSISVSDGAHSQKAVMTGWGSTIYASLSNLYLAFPDFYAYPMMGVMRIGIATPIGVPVFWRGFGGNTTIFRVAINGSGGVLVQSEGMIPGTVLNQYSLDENSGYLRVATTSWGQLANQTSVQVNNVYVLDQSMKVIGALENMAPSERIYSVRFLGDIGYVVTYQRVDPLFAISFKDPTAPKILSALQLTGFSDYLHPIGNGLLLGVGKDSRPAPGEQGAVLYLGVKLSLFNVSADGSSQLLANVTIGDRGSDTPVSSDPHAFVYDSQGGIVAFPILVAKLNSSTAGTSPWDTGNPVYQGAFFFRIASSGITLLGKVTQIPAGTAVDQASDLWVNRIVIIGSFAYTVSNRAVMVYSLTDFSLVGALKL